MKMIYDIILERICDTYFSLRVFLLLENYYKLIIRNYLKNSCTITITRFQTRNSAMNYTNYFKKYIGILISNITTKIIIFVSVLIPREIKTLSMRGF